MIKRKIKLPIKPVAAGIIILLGLFVIVGQTIKVLENLDYFKIKEVLVNKSEEGLDFSYLVGRNIFNLDLDKESRYISGLYPTYKKVGLVRIPPNRLFIVFTERKPLAYIKLYRYFFTDSDLVLFGAPPSPQRDDLAVVTGLETKIFGVKPGRRYNIRELREALNIIESFGLNRALREYKIKRIDVARLDNTFLFLQLPDYPPGGVMVAPQVLEVRIGQDNLRDKIRLLGDLLKQMKKDQGNIKYIDLRFKEPVIKFRDAR